jgi:hypothetical protein
MTPPDDAITITFPQPAPLLNMNDRKGWRAEIPIKRAWREAASWHAIQQLSRPSRGVWAEPSYVQLTIDVPDRRRRDPANIWVTKPVVDGLVDSLRLWPDDTPDWVTTIEPRLRVGRDHTITIHIWPRGDT